MSIHYLALDCEKESLRGGIRKFLEERSVLTFADDSEAVEVWSLTRWSVEVFKFGYWWTIKIL